MSVSHTITTRESNTPPVAPRELRSDPALKVHPSLAYPHADELRRFWDLTLTLTRSELRRKYLGSKLGYMWTVARPLLLFGVIYVVFTQFIFRDYQEVENYPLYLLMALVLWGFFAEATGMGVTSFVGQEGLLRKINFPRSAVTASLTLVSAFQFVPNLIIVGVFCLAAGLTPTLGWLLAVPLVALLVAFAIGVALLLGTAYVQMRDLQPLWEVALQILFWGSPIIYVATFPPEWLQPWLLANPIAAILTELRHLVLDPSAPSVGDVMGSDWLALVPLGVVVGVCTAAATVFRKAAPRIAEEL